MRSSLIPSLIANVRYNLNRKIDRIRIFEISAVYLRNSAVQDSGLSVAGYEQPKRVTALAYGPVVDEQWGQPSRNVDYFDVKADLEAMLSPLVVRFLKADHPALHPGRSAQIELDGKIIGYLGELHPRWQQKYELPLVPVAFEIDADALQLRKLPAFSEISKFPAVTRDLALVVKNDVAVQDILDAFNTKKATDPICDIAQAIVLFDEYRGNRLGIGEKSLAFRFTLQDTQSTLQDDRIDAAMSAFLTEAQERLDAKLRA